MEAWHPRALRLPPKPYVDAGPYVDGYAWRQIAHTTEGGPDYKPSQASFYGNAYWPHGVTGRVDGRARIVQHLPINVAAMAMENHAGGVETNRARAVQLEIAWWADRIHELPDDIAEVTADWFTWVASEVGSALTGPKFYGTDCGWTLAATDARQRFTPAAWPRFGGICGHQHVPENVHWDPGALDLATLLKPVTGPDEEDDMPRKFVASCQWAPGKPGADPHYIVAEQDVATQVAVASVNGAPFTPPWKDGQKGSGWEDFAAFGLWWRRYTTTGKPTGVVERADRVDFTCEGTPGTYTIATKA
jgi:hypothetical protein